MTHPIRANTLLMVKPASFGFNHQTAASNAFQNTTLANEEETRQKALHEFDNFVSALKAKGVSVLVFDDLEMPVKPDAVFPNNWISLHADGTVILYPMHAPNRRLERRQDIIDSLAKDFNVTRIIDLSPYENEGKFLEGTGSIVFNHENKIAYACLSPRTNKELFIKVSDMLGYKPVYFSAFDLHGKAIYHTNVVMCIGSKFAIICLDSISNTSEREAVAKSLTTTGHKIIDITHEQMNRFAGNMLAVRNNTGNNLLVCSQSADAILTAEQKKIIAKHCELLALPIETIETIGGGSARCMMAEVLLPPRA